MAKKVTVLFAGGFKPLHAGHVDLINKYANNPDVNEIKIFVSPSTRGFINQDTSFKVINFLINNPKICIEKVEHSSPISSACKFIESAKPGKYAIASSTKGNDHNRIKYLVNYYKTHKTPKGVKLVELNIDNVALVYKGRNDKFEGTPISASVLRQDIQNADFNNFKTNYQNYSFDVINTIWNLINDQILYYKDTKFDNVPKKMAN